MVTTITSALQLFARKKLGRSRLASRYLEVSRSTLVAQGYIQALGMFEKDSANVDSKSQAATKQSEGRLRAYFDSHREGNGIYKWNHYFDIYERHLNKFVDRQVNVCEIGVYSGGSLEMWWQYFGPSCQVYGVDIEPACRNYENEHVTILIGDQANRSFWTTFRQQVPALDVVIDDGGHSAQQQIVTLEETLPHLRPGGVYICEDIHGIPNHFSRYLNGLALNLNAARNFQENQDSERAVSVTASPFQSAIRSVSLYPFAAVIERNDSPIDEFCATKHGTSWQPFL